MKTYIAETTRANINAKGGQETLRWLVRADGIGALASILPGAAFSVVDSGGHLDQQAAEHGVGDGEAKQI